MGKEKFAMANYTGGQLNAIIKLLQVQGESKDAPERFLRGELAVSKPVNVNFHDVLVDRREIRFTVVSDGTTGAEWINRLEKQGHSVNNDVKEVLLSTQFKPTKDSVIEVVVLRGYTWKEENRISENILAYAQSKFQMATMELACLIREKLFHEELAILGIRYIMSMHEPFLDPHPWLLSVESSDDLCYGLGMCDGPADRSWDSDSGFAFIVSQS